MQVNIHEAKSNLSSLIEKALNGEHVIIAKAGKALVELRPIKQEIKFGICEGEIQISDDFDKTPKDIINSFYK
jgi:antitoxin (DNA-binding transcriptional repressor) of toxin-antitoxin stability system